MKKRIFGIDLGTTNSALSLYLGTSPEIIEIDGKSTFPSVVEYKVDGTVLTGKQAYEHKGQSNVVYSAKRDMGTDKVYKLTLDDGTTKEVTPVDVATEVLKGLVEKADKSYGKIKDVVITVPAYFNHSQREATLEASKRAGLNCVKIINEPTAASLAYGVDEKQTMEIIVIDVGGGTTDVTTVTISNLKNINPIFKEILTEGLSFDVTSTGGNNRLGGDDYNHYIYKVAVEDTAKNTGRTVSEIEEALPESMAIPKIENWKISNSKSILQLRNKDIVLTFIQEYKEKAMVYFWEAIKKCIDECLVLKAINDSGEIIKVGKKQLPKKCLLVGGSTKNQLLINCIKDFYAKEYKDSEIIIPNNNFADNAVALGAAVQGAILSDTLNGLSIKELNPLPVGLEYSIRINDKEEPGYFYTMIPKDAPIPVQHTEVYITSYDNQESLEVNVYQGTSNLTKYNLLLGTITIDNLDPAPAGEVEVVLTFSIDINGMLKVFSTYKDETKVVEVKSVLNKTYTGLSKNDRLIVKRIDMCRKFILASNQYTEMLDILNNWKVGTKPSDEITKFFATHKSEINAFNKAQMTKLFDTNHEEDAE